MLMEEVWGKNALKISFCYEDELQYLIADFNIITTKQKIFIKLSK